MIELVSPSRCTACNICVHVCPTNVFDIAPDGPPLIARQEDCQTCFMCEAYCPEDALFVAPMADQATAVNEAQLIDTRLLGSYRREIGWATGQASHAAQDQTYRLLETLK